MVIENEKLISMKAEDYKGQLEKIRSKDEIKGENISGFHRCFLGEPMYMDFASESLCSMVGYTRQELQDAIGVKYINLIHPDDMPTFMKIVQSLAKEEQTVTIQYRLIHKNGSTVYVNDTMTSKRLEDGNMWAFSVVVDITEFEDEDEEDTLIPNKMFKYGIMSFSCEEYPRVLYMDEYMKELLHIDEGISQLESLIKDNIFFMIPANERRKFREYLKKADETPINVEHKVICCGGGYACFMGWIKKERSACGEEFYYATYVDVTQKYIREKEHMIKNYYKAVEGLYDMIIEINMETQVMKYVYGSLTSSFLKEQFITLNLAEAFNDFINDVVVPEDKEKMRIFLKQHLQNHVLAAADGAHIIEFSVRMDDGEIRRFNGRFITLTSSVGFFGCNDITDGRALPANSLQQEQVKKEPEIYIRTFGYFDVFVNDKPIVFRHEKSKELLALLVDRKGGVLTSREAISCLWEDEPVDKTTQARFRKVAMRLKYILEEYGIADIVETVNGKRRLVADKVSCDLFDYLDDTKRDSNPFNGSYMTGYSWGEFTLAELVDYSY